MPKRSSHINLTNRSPEKSHTASLRTVPKCNSVEMSHESPMHTRTFGLGRSSSARYHVSAFGGALGGGRGRSSSARADAFAQVGCECGRMDVPPRIFRLWRCALHVSLRLAVGFSTIPNLCTRGKTPDKLNFRQLGTRK